MFRVLQKMGTTTVFVDAKRTVCLHGNITKTFDINKGVQ
jgi:hypothetical protein